MPPASNQTPPDFKEKMMVNIPSIQNGLFLSLILLSSGCKHEPPPPQQVIEQQALDVIDFDKLEPSIREFIELAQAENVVGRPTSEFDGLLQTIVSIGTREEGKLLDSYTFLPPITEELQNANQQINDGRDGVLQYVVFMIRVNKETKSIAYIYLVLQGF